MTIQKSRLLSLLLVSVGMSGFVSSSSAAISVGDYVRFTRDTTSAALNAGKYARDLGDTADSFRTAGSNPGGEFRIEKDSNGTAAGGVLSDAFKSFCLETNEYLSLGSSYYVSGIDDAAVKGGAGGGNPDYLSDATKWLYSAYRLSTLDTAVAGYVYNTSAAADALQNAIWNLEDEGVAVSGLALSLKNWALGKGTFTNGGADGTVKVLNIKENNANGTNMQSQLFFIATPPHMEVPEPASLAIWSALAGMGLVAGRLRRRRA